jgi:ClpP class serine protease
VTTRIPDAVIAAFRSQPWAISPAGLQRSIAVVSRLPVPPEALNPTALPARAGLELDNSRTVTVRDGVATIPVRGTLTRYAGFFSRISGGTSYGALAQDFQTALDSPNVRAILWLFDSPGGEVNGMAELGAQIHGARGTKPIVAYAGGELCSAAYLLASACDEIVGGTMAIAGCLGVRMSWTDTRAADAELGYVDYEWVSSETPKKALDPATEEGRARVQAMVDALADVMLTDVGTYRDIPREDVAERYGAGEVFVGAAAQKHGLIDRLGSYEALHTELAAAGRPSVYVPRWFARREELAAAASSSSQESTMATTTAATAGGGTTPPAAAGPAPSPAGSGGADTPTANAAAASAAAGADAQLEARLGAAREEGRVAGHAAGLAEGRTAGADAEHARMQGVLAFANRGSLTTIQACLADRACTPEAAAARILAEDTSAAAHHLAGLAASEQTIADLGGPPAPNAKGAATTGQDADAAAARRTLETFAALNPNRVAKR